MAAQKGRLHLLKLGADGAGGTVAGMRTTNTTFNNEPVDITNKSSAGFRELLEGAGTQSLDVSIDGVATDVASYETLKGYAMAGSINSMQIVTPDNDTFSCGFLITNFQENSGHNTELTFSASLQSSGAITYTPA